jgi:hypothetical protein
MQNGSSRRELQRATWFARVRSSPFVARRMRAARERLNVVQLVVMREVARTGCARRTTRCRHGIRRVRRRPCRTSASAGTRRPASAPISPSRTAAGLRLGRRPGGAATRCRCAGSADRSRATGGSPCRSALKVPGQIVRRHQAVAKEVAPHPVRPHPRCRKSRRVRGALKTCMNRRPPGTQPGRTRAAAVPPSCACARTSRPTRRGRSPVAPAARRLVHITR